jgi:DNA (cytosine-5)-methyltransferase 1
LGHSCVYASEINEELQALYLKNFGIKPDGDIREVDVSKIPKHEILCAGFPCQPFSKAGQQNGMKDTKLGTLYEDILSVIREHHPPYFILENVPNLEKHDQGKTWDYIRQLLKAEDYDVRVTKLSPIQLGIPQIRERVYIVGSTRSLEKYDSFDWNEHLSNKKVSIDGYLDKNPKDARKVPDNVNECLDVWQEFLDSIPKVEKVPHPLWSMEFGATYPYETSTPLYTQFEELRNYKGSHGQSLKGTANMTELLKLLPSHARRDQERFPDWKIQYIRKNREFYERHSSWLDDWIPKIKEFPSSLQKLEWNCQSERCRDIRKYIIQIRASGVRVKQKNTFPSLIAMTSTQVPIIAWENRYMTQKEGLRLQSMDNLSLPESHEKAYEALGNAINVRVAALVATALVGKAADDNIDASAINSSYPPDIATVNITGRT